jgi:hypothetical protein
VAVTTEAGGPRAGPRRRRASKRTLRVLAWAGGATSFVASGVLVGLAPKPAAAPVAAQPQLIVVRKTVKRIVWEQAAATGAVSPPKVRYVYVGGGGGSAPAATASGSHPR